jgi:hypothetical protein
MNSTSQLDLHPDADSLNAFAEQALAVPEREQILAHLAGCSRCRQVIFLAQQAAARRGSGNPAHNSNPRAWFGTGVLPGFRLRLWRRRWRWWSPFIHGARRKCRNWRRPCRSVSEAVPTPAPQEQASAGAAHKPAQALAAKSLAGNAEFAARRRTPEELVQQSAPSAAPPAEPGASAPFSWGEPVRFCRLRLSPPQQETTAQFQPEPAVAAWQQEQQQATGATRPAPTPRAGFTKEHESGSIHRPRQPPGCLGGAAHGAAVPVHARQQLRNRHATAIRRIGSFSQSESAQAAQRPGGCFQGNRPASHAGN